MRVTSCAKLLLARHAVWRQRASAPYIMNAISTSSCSTSLVTPCSLRSVHVRLVFATDRDGNAECVLHSPFRKFRITHPLDGCPRSTGRDHLYQQSGWWTPIAPLANQWRLGVHDGVRRLEGRMARSLLPLQLSRSLLVASLCLPTCHLLSHFPSFSSYDISARRRAHLDCCLPAVLTRLCYASTASELPLISRPSNISQAESLKIQSDDASPTRYVENS
ncbi:hypothetical protein BKA62DRAFT_410005 [Auriculariales sp. MPI-PUGE-AT-0066]|nr:hypothetical protein BKA62DRAFT_410005 [Auriculariales sp. MPI-PUGE-AT-0066]